MIVAHYLQDGHLPCYVGQNRHDMAHLTRHDYYSDDDSSPSYGIMEAHAMTFKICDVVLG